MKELLEISYLLEGITDDKLEKAKKDLRYNSVKDFSLDNLDIFLLHAEFLIGRSAVQLRRVDDKTHLDVLYKAGTIKYSKQNLPSFLGEFRKKYHAVEETNTDGSVFITNPVAKDYVLGTKQSWLE